MSEVEETIESMKGKQLPILVGGVNWWPEIHVIERERKAVVNALEGLKEVTWFAANEVEVVSLERIDQTIESIKSEVKE